MMLDEKDLKIIEILKENARTSYTDIARQLGISDVAVLKRIRKLEQLGVIRKYTIIVDPRKLGFTAISVTGIDVVPEQLFTILEELKDKSYVRFLALTSGDHSIITTIWAKDSKELAKIHNEISKMNGVKKVCPAVILDVLKE